MDGSTLSPHAISPLAAGRVDAMGSTSLIVLHKKQFANAYDRPRKIITKVGYENGLNVSEALE